TVRGTFQTNPGVTFASTMSGLFAISGDLSINGPAVSLPTSQSLRFSGTTQRLAAGGLTINGHATLPVGTTLTVGAAGLICNDSLVVDGELRLDTGSTIAGVGPYVYHPVTGVLSFVSSTSYPVLDARYWPSVSP